MGADDYSKANFQRQEESDGASNVAGAYSVALPDGRIQHVTYTSNGYDGYVADVTYEEPLSTLRSQLTSQPLLTTLRPVFIQNISDTHRQSRIHTLNKVGKQ